MGVIDSGTLFKKDVDLVKEKYHTERSVPKILYKFFYIPYRRNKSICQQREKGKNFSALSFSLKGDEK